MGDSTLRSLFQHRVETSQKFPDKILPIEWTQVETERWDACLLAGPMSVHLMNGLSLSQRWLLPLMDTTQAALVAVMILLRMPRPWTGHSFIGIRVMVTYANVNELPV